jgi:hypothetical protein
MARSMWPARRSASGSVCRSAWRPRHASPWIVVIPIESAWDSASGTTGYARVADLARELDSLAAQLLDCRTNVLAHQVQLVVGVPVGGMGGQLSGGGRERSTTRHGVDRAELEHVAEERPVCLCIAGEMIA